MYYIQMDRTDLFRSVGTPMIITQVIMCENRRADRSAEHRVRIEDEGHCKGES